MTNPFDIITTRIITQSVIDDENNEIEPLGFVEMGMKLYDEGGLTSFLVGWQAREDIVLVAVRLISMQEIHIDTNLGRIFYAYLF